MKHIKTFESFNISSDEKLNEGMWDKLKTAVTGGVPKIEKLLAELPAKIEKDKEAYEDIKKELEGYKKKNPNAAAAIKNIQVPASDQTFPYTDENYLALAAFYNFNVNIIPNIARTTGKAMPSIGMQQFSGVGAETGHSSGPKVERKRRYQQFA